MSVRINITVDQKELLDALSDSSSREELIEFVKELDLNLAAWDFTLPLCEYFANLKKEYEKEQEEDARRRK